MRKGTAIKTKAERIVRKINALVRNPYSGSGLPPIRCWRWGFPCRETLRPELAADCRRIVGNSGIIAGHFWEVLVVK